MGLGTAWWLMLGAVLAAYLMGSVRERRHGRGWSCWRTASFVIGAGLLAFAVSPRLATWAHHDLRGHMVQHLILGMLAPLGLVLAAPATLLLRSLSVPNARRITAVLRSRPIQRMTHPATALVLDIGGLYLLYLTPLYAAMHVHPLLRGAVHFHFLAAGYLFAWAIAGPDPAPHRPSFGTRLWVLFLAIAAHSTLAKMMYAYGWPRGTHHGLEQIQSAAQIMYYGGDVAELLLAMALFASWYRTSARRYERRQLQSATCGIELRPERLRVS